MIPGSRNAGIPHPISLARKLRKATATADDSEDDVPLANLESNSAAPMSLQDELELTLTSLKTSETPQPRSSNNNLEVLIKKKMNYFESGGLKGTYLQFGFNSLMTIVPASIEAERDFSAAGYLVCSQEPFSG
ncbi:hypothetical protein ILUMI_17507 [Ignelater luminosus]|uniref:HAT C-terminal dimerisation domain-containing protein n=1 Tax=Ignelater luminosus TaxID=2038154 RepID=A0A8K0CN58_IGNLU|nr:hypothetical protein ILUMI_17507 [Ignelater luminosus]